MCWPISASMLMPLIWMKRGLPSLKAGARDRAFALVGDHGDLDVGVEDAGLVLPGGRDLDAAFLGDHGGGDQVHVRVLAFMTPAITAWFRAAGSSRRRVPS
jgi:hypothetical protein